MLRAWFQTARFALLPVTAVALASFGSASCARDTQPAAEPVHADEPPPPLPPASGTPIGYLLDDGRLKLSDDQRTKLKAIDEDLAARLANLDSVLRNTSPANAATKDDSRGGIDIAGSAARNGQSSGNASTADTGSSGRLTPKQAAENAEIRKSVPTVRAQNVRAAIAHALALFDAEQKKTARTLLVERGVDPDTGQFEAKGEPGAITRDAPK